MRLPDRKTFLGRPSPWRLIALLIFLAVILSPFISLTEPSRCWLLRHEVLSALDGASSVKVIEHSARFDGGFNPDYQEKIYATLTLTPKQIDELRKALPFSVDSDTSILKCKFEEHHRIEITRLDGSILVLHLCFHCGQAYVSEQDGKWLYEGIMPPAWPASLHAYLTSLKLHLDGPWPLAQ